MFEKSTYLCNYSFWFVFGFESLTTNESKWMLLLHHFTIWKILAWYLSLIFHIVKSFLFHHSQVQSVKFIRIILVERTDFGLLCSLLSFSPILYVVWWILFYFWGGRGRVLFACLTVSFVTCMIELFSWISRQWINYVSKCSYQMNFLVFFFLEIYWAGFKLLR